MEYVYAFLGGLSCKIYDDLNDNGFIQYEIIKEILKGSQWVLLTLLSYNDFNFSAINFIINGLNALNNWKEWNFPYESSLLMLTPFFLLISFQTRVFPNRFDWLYIFVFVACMAIEPLVISEEFSVRKLIVRILALINSCIGLIGGIYFGISPSFVKVSCYAIGYFLFSVGFQAYLLYKTNEDIDLISS